MFTGIIEELGRVESIADEASGRVIWISSPISNDLKPDQSIAHNGACLTVEQVTAGQHRITAVPETLAKTNLSKWRAGDLINLERCMPLNGRLDGHLVQGHVDTTATCSGLFSEKSRREYTFTYDPGFASLLIEKGSITINGISLTAFNVSDHHFTVAIIPFTYEHTNMKNVSEGTVVNLEFDIIGKYIQRHLQLQ